MNHRSRFVALALLIGLVPNLWAKPVPNNKPGKLPVIKPKFIPKAKPPQMKQAEDKKPEGLGRSDTGDLLRRETVERNVAKVTKELTWYDDLEAAKAKAKESDRIILWIHVLGDIGDLC